MNILSTPWLFAFAAISALILGGLAGYRVVDRLFQNSVVTKESAIKLLTAGNVSGWNAFRRLNPDWRPEFRDEVFESTVLPDVDFRRADFDGSIFRRANLDGADFSAASLRAVDFRDASLRRAVFDEACLIDADLRGADIHQASMRFTNLEGAKFDDNLPEEGVSELGARPHSVSPLDLEGLAALPPKDFEVLVARILSNAGYKVELFRGSGDRGIDMIASQKSALGDIQVVVQTKRVSDPTRSVTVDAVRALEGVRQMYPAELAMLVTNGRFSSGALEAAAHLHAIRLVDGSQLGDLYQEGLREAAQL
jgi:uncharacterized protein YjbI with pentapeptide repeats